MNFEQPGFSPTDQSTLSDHTSIATSSEQPAEQIAEVIAQPEVINPNPRKLELQSINPEIPVDRQSSILPNEMIAALQNPDLSEAELANLKNQIQAIGLEYAQANQFSETDTQIILEALQKVPAEVQAHFSPKATVDVTTGRCFSEYFPLAKALEKIKRRSGPSGVSISIITVDGDSLIFKRSLNNGSCRGFLGPVAGFLNDIPEAKTVQEIIDVNTISQVSHETGLPMASLKSKIVGSVNVDYPSTQTEIIVSAVTSLTKAEILALINNNQGEGPIKLAEKSPFLIPRDKILAILADPECHIATQHAIALATGLGESPEWHQALELIKKLPQYPSGNKPEEAWDGLEALLKKYNIDITQTA